MTAKQPSLFSFLPAEHTISAEPLSDREALRPGLVKILITKTQGDTITRFSVPVQWTPAEAAHLIHEIRGISWQLDEEGFPIDYEAIIEICEQFCNQQGIF